MKINLLSAFYQLYIIKGDEWKTTFRTCYRHFKYLVMSFSLTNAAASFQAYINDILYEVLDQFCITYQKAIECQWLSWSWLKMPKRVKLLKSVWSWIGSSGSKWGKTEAKVYVTFITSKATWASRNHSNGWSFCKKLIKGKTMREYPLMKHQ